MTESAVFRQTDRRRKLTDQNRLAW